MQIEVNSILNQIPSNRNNDNEENQINQNKYYFPQYINSNEGSQNQNSEIQTQIQRQQSKALLNQVNLNLFQMIDDYSNFATIATFYFIKFIFPQHFELQNYTSLFDDYSIHIFSQINHSEQKVKIKLIYVILMKNFWKKCTFRFRGNSDDCFSGYDYVLLGNFKNKYKLHFLLSFDILVYVFVSGCTYFSISLFSKDYQHLKFHRRQFSNINNCKIKLHIYLKSIIALKSVGALQVVFITLKWTDEIGWNWFQILVIIWFVLGFVFAVEICLFADLIIKYCRHRFSGQQNPNYSYQKSVTGSSWTNLIMIGFSLIPLSSLCAGCVKLDFKQKSKKN